MEDPKNHAAGELKDLSGAEAIAKIKELAKDKTCHLGTYKGPTDLDSRPMYASDVDAAGIVWFMGLKTSKWAQQIAAIPQVDLLFADAANDKYLHLKGHAAVVQDQGKIDELWSEFVKTWVPKGRQDPDLALIRVQPTDVYYWDTQHGKVISLLKIAYSTVTGATMDDGREGHLKV